jgi:hypothetical protein
VPAPLRAFFTELFRNEILTLPIPEDSNLASELKRVSFDEKEYFEREVGEFRFDMPTLLRAIEAGEPCELTEGPPRSETFYYRVGFSDYIDNHEFVTLYSGRSMEELRKQKTLAEISASEGEPYFDEAYDRFLEQQDRLMLPVIQ